MSENGQGLDVAQRARALSGHLTVIAVAMLALLLSISISVALASTSEVRAETFGLATSADVLQAIESGSSISAPQLTDPKAAEELPHQDLARSEAQELLEGVFEPVLEQSSGELEGGEVERYLSPTVALVPSEEGQPANQSPPLVSTPAPQPPEHFDGETRRDIEKQLVGEGRLPSVSEGAKLAGVSADEVDPVLADSALMQSTAPLQTEGPSGNEEAVDLSLEHSSGQLQPTNPLVEVGLPEELGEGVELGNAGVRIELANAPAGRAPSTVNGSTAFYPNVAQDTDFAVMPTLTGVETLTQLRSADAPHSQALELDLPPGATLEATEDGGARAVSGQETLLAVQPPVALGAKGESVPVKLGVSDGSLLLTVSPGSSTSFPVLVDPLIQTYEWMKNGKTWENGICSNSFGSSGTFNQCNNREEWGIEGVYGGPASGGMTIDSQFGGTAPLYVQQGTPGLYVKSSGELHSGDQLSWIYTVPRYFTDQEKYGARPTSYISKMTLSNVLWQAYSSHPSPYLYMGLWSPNNSSWVSSYSHEGATEHGTSNMSFPYEFINEPPAGQADNSNRDAKVAYVGIRATETQPAQYTDVYVGSAAIRLEDKEVPSGPIATGPAGWVNQAVSSIGFTASDTGLGVSSITASTEQLGSNGQPLHSWKASYGCLGVADAACPRTWKSSEAGHPALKVEPALLSSGENFLNVVVEDPVGNKSSAGFARVLVDHVAPVISVSGSATEQATLGTKRPTYTVKANATDGSAGVPQSGVAKASIEFDGALVKQTEPGCATENCTAALEWTIEASKYAAGEHTIKVSATDAVGISKVEERKITLNATPPALGLSGTMTEQATLGSTRPRYTLSLSASAEVGLGGPPPGLPTYRSAFGKEGSADGQLAESIDIAIDPKGNLLVADRNNNRIEKFSPEGAFISKFATAGSGNGQLSHPVALAIDAKGNVWVADHGNDRVEEFNEKGEYVFKFGTTGTTNGKLDEPEGIAIDAKGNIWVADAHRVQEFNEKGEFIRLLASQGSGSGQISEPAGIDVGPANNVWIADWGNQRVSEFSETGSFIRQFGSAGTGNGQFEHPIAVYNDAQGNVWVSDQWNGRVQEFDQSGKYVGQFGSGGTGEGKFIQPVGITGDFSGSLWVADKGNDRVQRWTAPTVTATPTYRSAFGKEGSADGQLAESIDIAIDPKGNLLVADRNNNRIEKFSPEGAFISKFATAGSGNGQLSHPVALAIDAKGNVWVADHGNDRVEEFNEKGEYVFKFGTTGTTNGKLDEPEGIAIDAKGNIWVADAHRVQEFNEKGEFIRLLASQGSGSGQISEPAGIDVGPANNVWIADWGNQRVSEFSETGSFIRQFGSAGTGNGQFEHPIAVYNDAQGNVWVSDQWNGRVQEFDQSGKYVAQFGSGGTGEGKFIQPVGMAADSSGNLWVADKGNDRVQRWAGAPPNSEVTTEVTVDGKQVDVGRASCATEHCPLARQWTLESPSYLGNHTVVIKATDGLGNMTTKSLPIADQPDTTKPSIESGGSLINAPEGWVEQEGYGVNISAKDGGYGTSSLELKIDGKQVAATSPASCPDGGCEAHLQQTIDMAPYSGGAHPAEIVATDGAGNAAVQKWTINVDPAGHITANEVQDTLEAADDTSGSTVVAATSEILGPEQRQDGDNPGLSQEGNVIESTGVPDATAMTTEPSDGFVIETPEGGIEIIPTVSQSANDVAVVAGVAGVASNIGSEADSVIRPEYDGAQTFEAIRSATARHSFSWTVHLEIGQRLEASGPEFAEVFYANGKLAFLITAEPAHDAIGAAVPTSLEAAGNVLTLNVDLSSPDIVYPVVAGQGWEGGYTVPAIIQGPEDEGEIREKREEEERKDQEEVEETWPEVASGNAEAPGPPLPPPPYTKAQANQAIALGSGVHDVQPTPLAYNGLPKGAHISILYRSACGTYCDWFKMKVFNAAIITGAERNWSKWENGTQVHAHVDQAFAFEATIQDTTWNCGWRGPYTVNRASGEHLIAYAHFTIEVPLMAPSGETMVPAEANYGFQAWVYPNGFQAKHINRGWSGEPNNTNCPTTISY